MTKTESLTIVSCRICSSARLHKYLDLGRTPLANSYVPKSAAAEPEFSEELCIQVCLDCGLSQLTKVVPPDLMFRNYLYVSGTTSTIRDHFSGFAGAMAKSVSASSGDLALDLASNDGTLLDAFRSEGLKPLGVDPAVNLAAEANAKGLTTICDYWGPAIAERIVRESGRAKIITAANVFAHTHDLHAFCAGVRMSLHPDGAFAIECPYVLDFIRRSEFDTAYHEHLSYVGLFPLTILLKQHGLELFDAEYFPNIHGGSIRAMSSFVGRRPPSERLKAMMAAEADFGLTNPDIYDAFSKAVLANRELLRKTVHELRVRGKKIWAYGASAKGNTLMNFFQLDHSTIPTVVDDNPKKWGLLTPGSKMEIVGIDALPGAKVDYLLLLAWNFEAEIRSRCRRVGYTGKFLVPVPMVVAVDL